ncbi:MAG: helix-turn-helix transcriptional regulator [Oscillospiraceae bacterium]|nr:helix-turn-helix transcriptional regulator [Oscillospiraceae bacterium]
MNKNTFDFIMDYIDENIDKSDVEIRKNFFRLIGRSSKAFDECLKILTGGMTLYHYISDRKLYFAAKELISSTTKISDIATKYYSEQSAFTRAMKVFTGMTPGEIRKHKIVLPDNKLHLKDFINISSLEPNCINTEDNLFFYPFECKRAKKAEELSEFYNIDIDTVYQIYELADRLDLPIGPVIEKIFFVIVDTDMYKAEHPNDLPYDILRAIDENLISHKEINDIRKYYKCNSYDLDYFMISRYCEIHHKL